ncbi:MULTISPECIES: DUF721 domain-containing protein [unclassified Sphingomonas]|nr:DUF721 domain-containing protein [Sphingomonas sp. SFZ2018-12]
MTKSTRTPQAVDSDRPRGGRARPVADLLPDIGRAAFRKFGFVQSSIVSRWPEIVGERYARVSAPESIRFPQGARSGGLLTLAVAPAHATMMQHIGPEIMERVNRFFGYAAVARIAFRPGQFAARAAAAAPVRPAAATIDLGDSVRAIADPELREVLAALAAGIVEQPPVIVPVMGKVR